MEHLIDSQHGATVLLAGLIIVLALHLLLKLGEFVFELFKSKESLKEKRVDHLISMVSSNTADIAGIKDQMEAIKKLASAFEEHSKKTEVSTRRIVAALKKITGKEWPEIRKHILEDEIT